MSFSHTFFLLLVTLFLQVEPSPPPPPRISRAFPSVHHPGLNSAPKQKSKLISKGGWKVKFKPLISSIREDKGKEQISPHTPLHSKLVAL